MDSDILVEMTEEDVNLLFEMYEKHKESLPHLYSFLQNCLQAGIGSDYVTFYSPRNCWKEDGTFIASMPIYGHDIVLHSLDPSGRNLTEGLRLTKRFKFLKDPARNYTLFYAVHERFYPMVNEVIAQAWQQEILWADTLYLWHLPREKTLLAQLDYGGDIYLQKIQPKDAAVVNANWPFSYPTSESKILQWLKLTDGFGAYLKSTHEMVSWVASSALGQMSALHTQEEHRNKGYATLVVSHMVKYLAEIKKTGCCATVHIGNVASEKLMAKLGFRQLFKCQYIAVANKN